MLFTRLTYMDCPLLANCSKFGAVLQYRQEYTS